MQAIQGSGKDEGRMEFHLKSAPTHRLLLTAVYVLLLLLAA